VRIAQHVAKLRFESRIRELVAGFPRLSAIAEPRFRLGENALRLGPRLKGWARAAG
jgi:hypothetical protein